ncbi:MAG: hypothetical protein J3K34DRAFT_453569 [Monoraphidium minutum]|nr:MAG: hypothetical protein J3K34DRAFT_453569 [Monoraphidium minutum]
MAAALRAPMRASAACRASRAAPRPLIPGPVVPLQQLAHPPCARCPCLRPHHHRRRCVSGAAPRGGAGDSSEEDACWPQPPQPEAAPAPEACDCADTPSSSGQSAAGDAAGASSSAGSSSAGSSGSLGSSASAASITSSSGPGGRDGGGGGGGAEEALSSVDATFGGGALALSSGDAGGGGGVEEAAPPPHDGSGGIATVPWGWGKIFQVMGLWLLAYVGLGQVVVPLGLGLAGLEYEELGYRATALLHLAMDAAQLAATLAILGRCLGAYRPRERGLFPLRWQRGRWLGWVAAGAAAFPLVEWLSAQSWGLWSGGGAAGAAEGYGAHVWCAQLEASLGGGDWVTGAAYLGVVSVCAPLWEEAVFRGFLLASLARHVGPRLAALGSALFFALCHFRADTFAPLLVLGLVFGGLFLRTNNLAPSVLCHSLWNCYVLLMLAARH